MIVVLDPNYKLECINFDIRQLYDDNIVAVSQHKVKVALHGLFNDHRNQIKHTTTKCDYCDSNKLLKKHYLQA